MPSFAALLTLLVLWRGIAATSSESEIGVFALCTQLAFYLTFLQGGLDTAAVLSMSGLLSVGQRQSAANQYHYLSRINRRIGAGVIVFVAIVSGACSFANLPTPELAPLAATFACVLGSTHAMAYLTRPFVAALSAEHRLIELSWVTVGQSLFRFACGYFAYLSGAGIYSLAIGELASQIAVWRLLRVLASRHCGWIVLPAASGRPAGQLRRGAIISVGTIGWALETGSDVLLLQWLPNGLALVAVFTLWSRFPAQALVITVQLNHNATSPLRSAWAADRAAGSALFRRIFLTQIGLSAAVAVCVGIWLPSVVHFWLGGSYDIEDSRSVSASLAAILAARSMMHLVYTACSAFDIQNSGNTAIWVCLAVKTAIGIAYASEYGLAGLLLAGVVAWLPAYLLATGSLVRIGGGSGRLFAFAAGMLAAIWFVPWFILPAIRVDTLTELIAGIGVAGVVAGAGLLGWLLVMRVVRLPQLLRRA